MRSIQLFWSLLALVAMGALAPGQVLAQTESPQAQSPQAEQAPLDVQTKERARIAAERDQLETRFAAEEAACQARFFVNACLNKIRPPQREALADLRRQEILLDDAERKRKAAEQLEKIEEKGSEQRKQEAAEKAQENVRKGAAGAAEAAEKAQAQSQKATQAAERRDATLTNQARKAAEAPERAAAQTQAQTRAADLRQRQQEAATRKAERERRIQQAPATDRQPLPPRP